MKAVQVGAGQRRVEVAQAGEQGVMALPPADRAQTGVAPVGVGR
ncbi:MAG TPA: hypothetical protein VEW94_11340 [Chloroflexia bacterium]|nr:hypothetical protein [Chloroflexia bacterium]